MATPRETVVGTLGCLLLALCLNIEAVVTRVSLQPESDHREAVLAILQPLYVWEQDVGATSFRRWVRRQAGRGDDSPHVEDAEFFPSFGGLSDAPAIGHVVDQTGEGEGGFGLVHDDSGAPAVAPPIVPGVDRPLRVWVFGDSLLNMGGPRIATLLEMSGNAEVWVDSRPNTGITRPDYFDWPGALEERLSTRPKPDVVVFLMGANDGQNVRIDGKSTGRWTEAWQGEVRRRFSRMMGVLDSAGAEVLWLGLPGMRGTTHQRTADLLNSAISAEADKHVRVRFFPIEPYFAIEGKRFSLHLEDSAGRRFPARANDGVHFTWSGSRVLAQVVVDTLQERWPALIPGSTQNTKE